MTARSLLLALSALVLVFGLLLVFDRPSQAEDEEGHHIIYLNITGEGPTAKAWYSGAPPAGVLLQEALDKFSAEGYRVTSVSPSQRPLVQNVLANGTTTDPRDAEQFFILLLERP